MHDDFSYVIKGSGPVILFLAGWNNPKEVWSEVVNNLINKYCCVCLDLPGFGGAKASEVALSVKDYKDHVKNFLKSKSIKPDILVGHSFGGKVVIELCQHFPQSKIVLVDASLIKPRKSLKRIIVNQKVKLLKKRGLSIEKYGSHDYQSSQGTMRLTFLNVVNTYYLQELKQIKNSTLIFWGHKDKDTPLYMAYKIKHLITHAKLVISEGSHFSFQEDPCFFCTALIKFVEEDI